MSLTIKILIAGLCMVLLLVSLQFGLRWFADLSSFGGFTADKMPVKIRIDQTSFDIPQNVIRFENQRNNNEHGRIDLVFQWPGLQGYTPEARDVFLETDTTSSLIFVSLENTEPVGDATRRLNGIYRRFFVGKPWRGPDGLIGQSMDVSSGYSGEDVYYAKADQGTFVTRCLQKEFAIKRNVKPTCIYSYALENNLNVHVRFHIDLLDNWRSIQSSIKRQILSMRSN